MKQTDINLKNSRNTPAAKAVTAILETFPGVPTRALAKMLVKKHPKLFSNYESARASVRYRRGAAGKRNRKPRRLEASITPRIALPQSDERTFAPFAVENCSRVLVLSDIHIPYHTISALDIAIAEGKRRNVDCILLNGDTLDFHALSRFERNPEAKDFKAERRLGIQLLEYLRQEFPRARIIFKEGNHDERLRAYVIQKGPEIYDESILGLYPLLHMERLGVELVSDKRAVMLGGLFVLHGHELHKGFAPPVNPARGAYLKAKVSILIGHHHKTSEHTETALDGSIVTTWSTGCLSDLHPAYAPFNSYNHGFANVEIDKLNFNVTNHRIHRGVLLN